MSGTRAPAFRFCFSPPNHGTSHGMQHQAECRVHAVILLPDVKAYWFPLVELATVRSIEVAPVASAGCFQWPSPDGGLRNWRYPRWGVVVYEVDFSSVE